MPIVVDHITIWLRARSAEGDRGATMVEYSLILVLLALVCIAAVTVLGRSMIPMFDSSGSAIANAH